MEHSLGISINQSEIRVCGCGKKRGGGREDDNVCEEGDDLLSGEEG
jgi:hypothetical protein